MTEQNWNNSLLPLSKRNCGKIMLRRVAQWKDSCGTCNVANLVRRGGTVFFLRCPSTPERQMLIHLRSFAKVKNVPSCTSSLWGQQQKTFLLCNRDVLQLGWWTSQVMAVCCQLAGLQSLCFFSSTLYIKKSTNNDRYLGKFFEGNPPG